MSEKPDLIRELQDELYSRKSAGSFNTKEHELKEKYYDVPKDWPEEKISTPTVEMPKKNHNILYWFLLLSIIFFVGALSYAAYTVFNGSNLVSANNIGVEISGPVSVPGGEKLKLDVSITNKNKAPLRLVELIAEYPPGTHSASDSSQELQNERLLIGDIASGDTARKELGAILFGEEHSIANIKYIIQYRLEGSNQVYTKDVPYEITLSSNPILLSVESPHETISGQPLSMNITLRSNTSEVLHNVILEAQYPSGFSFVSSNPDPRENKKSWILGDIAPGVSKVINLVGSLSGEDEESRTFRFETGIGSDRNPESIDTSFAGFKQEVSIKKPFMGITLDINGKKDSEISVPAKDPIRVDVTYINNLPVNLRDGIITVTLSGVALDEEKVDVSRGFYQSTTNTVRFDSNTATELSDISPGETGVLSFILTPKTKNVTNPEIDLSGGVVATRVEGSGVPDQFGGVVKRTILVQSEVGLSAKSNFRDGPLQNTGSIPPKAEKETTYTITLSMVNTTSDIANAKVTAIMPSYVKLIPNISPENENFSSADSISGGIVWNLGNLLANTGNSRPPRTVSFQVSVTPSLSQIGSPLILLDQINFTGEDRFSKVKVSSSALPVTTKTSDSQSKSGDDLVVQ